MPKKLEITLYQIQELEPKARARAIEKWRHRNAESGIHVEQVTEALYAELAKHGWTAHEYPPPEKDRDIDVEWSLSCCQGDGACFYNRHGTWYSSSELLRIIAKAVEHGDMKEQDASYLRELIQHHGFSFRLVHRSNYCHAKTITSEYGYWIDPDLLPGALCTSDPLEAEKLADSLAEDLLQMARDLCHGLEKIGYSELEYFDKDETIIEDMTANEALFLASGKLWS